MRKRSENDVNRDKDSLAFHREWCGKRRETPERGTHEFLLPEYPSLMRVAREFVTIQINRLNTY